MAGSILAGASDVTIYGGTFSVHSNVIERASAFDKLSAAAAHSALHDAPARTDESRCHWHTRTNVLHHLECWAQGICDEGASVFWLHGGAGAGKSAVMQTLAERCVGQGLALGSFFFSRTDTARDTAEVLVPTLVYQLAQHSSSSMDVLGPIIDRDPLIFKKSFKVQMRTVFVPVLRHLVQLKIITHAPQSPRVFLIDGLDECSDPDQQKEVIQAVAAVCHEHRIPVKFLIASRQEHQISTSFRWYKQANRVLGTISLSEDTDAENDIRRFIENECLKIRLQHPFSHMIPSEWPNLYDITGLVWKSSSHFIYASTAMKYIWSAKENPVRSLQVVLGLEVSRTVSPFAELDALYHHILGSAAHRDKVLQILAHCVFASLPSSVSMASAILNCSRDDLFIYLADMGPLVVVSQPGDGDEVKLLHASLGDFLRDHSRSGSLYVEYAAYLASKLDICFQLLDLHSRQQLTKPDQILYHPRTPDNRSSIFLTGQVMRTIQEAGHLLATQEVLRRYSLLNFYQWRLCFEDNLAGMSGVLSDLLKFFLAVHSIKTLKGDTLFSSSVEDFFDILQSHVSLENAALAAAIFTLIFTGYPALALCKPLSFHLGDKTSWSSTVLKSALETISTADLASIHQRVNTSPKRLVLAAEAILEYLFGDEVGPHYSRYRYGLQQRIEEAIMVPGLLAALGWVLPKVGISEKIALYSGRTFLRDIYQRDNAHISAVEKCLEEYNYRVQDTKLKEIDQRIENGDVNALMEKSRTLELDTQD